MTGPPLWQRQIGRVVNAIGPRMESVTQRDEFAIAVGVAHTVSGTLRRRFERQSRRALHLLNLPAGSDVRALRNQVASLERQVRELGKALEDGQGRQVPRARVRPVR
jgi:predicted transcriptional regulator